MNTNDRALSEAKNVAAKLATLVGDERKVLVAFLRHLIEFDQKHHYAKFGHGSLFTYCTDELRLSIGSTSRRMTLKTCAPHVGWPLPTMLPDMR